MEGVRGDEEPGEASEGHQLWAAVARLQRDGRVCSGDELLNGVADQLVLQQAFSQLQQSARGFVLVPYGR